MIGLNTSLSLATQALQAQEGAVGITSNNIANVNTPGYSRQVVNLSAEALLQNGRGVDDGVTFQGYTSVRDQLLAISVNAKTAQGASLSAQSASLAGINSAFAGTTTGIGAALSNFFSSVSGLSTNAADPSARQTVLASATQLANAFHQGSAALLSAQAGANAQVASTVAQINSLAKEIASLNGQISSATGSGAQGGPLQDQRDQLVTQLAGLTGVNAIQTGDQPALTTGNGTPLVIGNDAFALQVSTGPDGLARVLDGSGNDITNTLTTGTVGGALTTRDATVPGFLQQLNDLASQFASAVNAAQASGYDATGAPGQPMFSFTGTNASSTIALALSSASGLAASSDGSAGSSGNLTNMLFIQTSALPSGSTPMNSYADLVSAVGSAAASTSTNLSATQLALQQLQSQQAANSGVSLDEESGNLIRYQQAYSAAAHVISTVNDLFTVVMNMGAGA